MKNKKILFGLIVFLMIIIFAPLSTMSDAAVRPAQKSPPKTTPRKTEPKTPQKLQEEAEKAPASTPNPDTIPQARIEEAEQAFTRAWDAFVRRDYWQAMSQLDRAQAANIFFVDVYFLRGLVQRKMGDLDGAQKSISGFLEVRTRDETSPYILRGIIENKSDISAIVSPSPYPTRRTVLLVDVNETLKATYTRPYSAKGFGKLQGFATKLCFADTLGDHLLIRSKQNSGAFQSIPIEAPVVGLLPGDGTIAAFTVSGDVYRISETSSDLMGALSNTTVSDAAYISSEEIIVSDPVGRRVLICSFPALEILDAWASDDKAELLFEPVALDCYGPWAAIADRANGRIYFLNLLDYSSFFVKEDAVRDVIWNKLGDLVTVNEKGEIASHAVDFAKKTATRELLRGDATDAWGLFKYESEIYCANVLGTKLWHIKESPPLTASTAFLSTFYPKLGIDETLSMSGTITTPFQSWAAKAPLTAMSMWNDNIITSSLALVAPRTPHAIGFSKNAQGDAASEIRLVQAESGGDVLQKLAPVWTGQRDILTNLIVDSRLGFTREDLMKITTFCMFNGLQLDIWARSVPSVELMKASGATGGNVYYSLNGRPDFHRLPNELRIQLAVPYKSAASGYPDRAALATYMNIGQLSARDWMPLWIDLLTK